MGGRVREFEAPLQVLLGKRHKLAGGRLSSAVKASIDPDRARIAIPETDGRDVRAALRVSRAGHDDIILLQHDGGLFVPYAGTDYWSHGPRAEAGMTAEDVATLLAQPREGGNAFVSSLMPDISSFRRRTGPLKTEDAVRQVAMRAMSEYLLVDGALHRRVREPVWTESHEGYRGQLPGPLAYMCRISIPPMRSRIAPACSRFDRPEDCEAYIRLEVHRRRDCVFAEGLQDEVVVLDPGYLPQYDILSDIIRTHGQSLVHRSEPHLELLGADGVEAWADMRDGWEGACGARPPCRRTVLQRAAEALRGDQGRPPVDAGRSDVLAARQDAGGAGQARGGRGGRTAVSRLRRSAAFAVVPARPAPSCSLPDGGAL